MNLNEQKKVAKDECMEAKRSILKVCQQRIGKYIVIKKEFVCC